MIIFKISVDSVIFKILHYYRLDSPSNGVTTSALSESKVGKTNFEELDLNLVESVASADQEVFISKFTFNLNFHHLL